MPGVTAEALAVPATQATPANITDLLLLADLMVELQQFTDVVRKHQDRPYTEHLKGILTAYCDTVEFLSDWLPLPDDETPET